MDSQINIKRSMEWKEFETTFSVKLNQQQKEAVQSTKGPVLLLAVPGSGKTTVLVTRLGYMIYCKNIPPESILTVTYTVAATKDMSERKNKMIELADAFIAFPGGTGTLEEISEIMSKVSLNHLKAPCIVYNLNGFYDSLKDLLNIMIEKGLSTDERQKDIFFVDNISEINNIINSFKY